MKRRTKGILVILATIAILMVAQTVLADTNTTIVDITPVDPSQVNKIGSAVYWVISGVGGIIIMAAGLVHSMLLSTAARNGNKKAMQYEAIGTVLISLFFFFGFPWIAGVVKGIAQTGITQTTTQQ